MAPKKTRVFSGVQPTGNLHLGNYLGAITKFVALQAEHDCLYCVVDLHAITVFQDPDELTRNTREVTAAFIASGIDPTRHIVFNQSQVSGHAELAWIFNCVARLGWLNRMTQFKEKAGKDRENASRRALCLSEPDGRRHSRSITRPMFRSARTRSSISSLPATSPRSSTTTSPRPSRATGYTDGFFPLPEPLITGPATRVMSLRDGTQEDVEVRRVRHDAHQSHRRCRRDRQEDQES